MPAKKKLGILLSGRGSNFEAILESIKAGRIPNAEIAIVISNRAEAGGIEAARRRGLETRVIPSAGKSREQHDAEVAAGLQEKKIDLICLDGDMGLFLPWFVEQFPRGILNIHPLLLSAFSR